MYKKRARRWILWSQDSGQLLNGFPTLLVVVENAVNTVFFLFAIWSNPHWDVVDFQATGVT